MKRTYRLLRDDGVRTGRAGTAGPQVALMVLLLVAVAGAGTAAGENELVANIQPRVHLQALEEELLLHNPELQAARKRYEAAQKRPSQEGAFPDPKISMGWSSATFPYPGAGLGSEPMSKLGMGISQEIPFPGKRSLREGMSRKEAESEASRYLDAELEILAQLKRTFHDLRFSYEAIDVLRRNRDLLVRLAKVAEARYSVGETSQQDLIKAQVEISILDSRLVILEQRKRSLAAEINGLLNREVDGPLGRPEGVEVVQSLPPLEQLNATAMRQSPKLRAQRAMIDARQFRVDLSKRNYYPDFEVMGGYFNQGPMKDMWDFRVQMNIPIFTAKKQGPAVEESAQNLLAAQREYRAREQMLSTKIRDRYLVGEAAGQLMDLYSKSIVPQANLALESSLSSYETGKTDFLSVLSNLTTILNYEISFHEQRAEYLKALASLEELVGARIG